MLGKAVTTFHGTATKVRDFVNAQMARGLMDGNTAGCKGGVASVMRVLLFNFRKVKRNCVKNSPQISRALFAFQKG
jgi:hypothetical protein